MHDRKTPKEKADALFRQLKAVPRELRDHIYGYILSERTNIVISAERFERDNRGDLSMPKPALLNTQHLRVIISDDDNVWTVPFAWLMALTDCERKDVEKLVIEFRVSEQTAQSCENLLGWLEASVLSGNANPTAMVDDFMARVKGMVKVDLLRNVERELVILQDLEGFDLSKISFEAGETGNQWDMASVEWKQMLDEVLAGVNGKKLANVKR